MVELLPLANLKTVIFNLDLRLWFEWIAPISYVVFVSTTFSEEYIIYTVCVCVDQLSTALFLAVSIIWPVCGPTVISMQANACVKCYTCDQTRDCRFKGWLQRSLWASLLNFLHLSSGSPRLLMHHIKVLLKCVSVFSIWAFFLCWNVYWIRWSWR